MTATSGDVIWKPSAAGLDATTLGRYLRWMRSRGVDFDDYDALWTWSTEELESFWASIWQFFGLGTVEPGDVLAERVMPGARWFPSQQINYAEQMLARAPVDHAVAVKREGEPLTTISRDHLAGQVGALAATLRAHGVSAGDRVAAYLPNRLEALVGLLASASIGAIWTACGPDFGTESVLDRFRQVEPSVLLAVDGYQFAGKQYDRRGVLALLQRSLPSLTLTIIVGGPPSDHAAAATIGWDTAIADRQPPCFEPLAFDHPLWVLFSSGTTGAPKGIVHGHGGIVLEHLKSLAFGSGVEPDDRLYCYSSTSWMIWNWLVGGLLVGACPVLYDGSPNYPDIGASWAVAAEAGAEVFCAGAAYMTACEKAGLDLTGDLAQPKLRSIVSTGSPLPTTTWLWLNEQLPDVRIESNSGGTDICTGIVGGSPWRPVWLGEISARCLGVSAAAFDDTGSEVIGEVGELVIREPMPSMPVAFWNDPDGSRYHDAYFDRFKGVWTHGDWITFTNHGSAIISGRSDATLNRGGVRMGSADIYAIVDVLAGVKDSVVVGIELPDGGYFMPLFVSLDHGYELDDVAQRIHEAIRHKLSPRHVPDVVVAAPAVPRTVTGKKLEVPIKRLLSGHLTSDEIAAGSLQDGDALVWYAAYGRENVTPLIEQATRASSDPGAGQGGDHPGAGSFGR